MALTAMGTLSVEKSPPRHTINGLEAAQRIRSGDGPCKNTPVIAVTANVFQDEREACLAAGMNDVVTKPIEMICLIECMSRCLLTGENPTSD